MCVLLIAVYVCVCVTGTIDILVYMDNDLQDIPDEWEDSDARNIADADMVALRGFSTKVRARLAIQHWPYTHTHTHT